MVVRLAPVFSGLVALICCLAISPDATRAVDEGGTLIRFHWEYQPNGTPDFSSGTIAYSSSLREDWTMDLSTGLRFIVSDIYFCDVDCPGGTEPVLVSNQGAGGVHDLGAIDFDSVTSVPDKSMGVGGGEFYNPLPMKAVVGHVYAVVTHNTDHYAKLKLDAIEPAIPLRQGDVDCSGTVTILDALALLVSASGAGPVAQNQPCPVIADPSLGVAEHLWGDLNCRDDAIVGDVIPELSYIAGITLEQHEPCVDIGEAFPLVLF